MNIAEFGESLDGIAPPDVAGPCLVALWHEAKGNWEAAHKTAQAVESADGFWVHAYLHRVEGDLANAGYWYRKAGQSVAEGSLKAEWDVIVEALLAKTN